MSASGTMNLSLTTSEVLILHRLVEGGLCDDCQGDAYVTAVDLCGRIMELAGRARQRQAHERKDRQ